MTIKVIGAGGIGTALIFPLARFLNFKKKKYIHMTVIDGDHYEKKNKKRQVFEGIGNKADITIKKLRKEFPHLFLKAIPGYITPQSVDYIISEGDIIFLCVDNHKTRKLVSDCCETMEDIVLISGGNKLTDGNVQIHVRQRGQNITLPIASRLHPEIRNPKDRRPDEIGCEEQIPAEPQLIFTNLFIASLMLNAFYAYYTGSISYDEVYADLIANKVRSVKRNK